MNKKIVKFYYIIIVPIKSGIMMVRTVFLLGLFSFLAVYILAFEVIIDNPIFKAKIEDLKSITTWHPVDNTKIFDKNGKVLSEQFNQYHVYLPYKKIPTKMINAIIAIEDRKFFKHPGIDVLGILRAALSYISPRGKSSLKQGASTITQQVVKNLLLSKEKTISRKVREIVLALYLETVISKEKILEIYCNSMFLGNGAYGVGAAAQRFFGKNIEKLKTHETALIAGLFQSPGKYNPAVYPKRAKKRQLKVIRSIYESRFITKNQFEEFKKAKLTYKTYESSYGKYAPYFVDYIIEESKKVLVSKGIRVKDSGLKIYTTLDYDIHSLAEKTFNENQSIFKMMERNIFRNNTSDGVVEGALLAIERRTGNIVAMLGGRDYERSKYNRAISSLRAPGSAIKTLVYTTAIQGGMAWNKQFYVTPITVGNYRPRTESGKLFTETTLFHSFYKSINSTAVNIGVDVGIAKVLRLGKKLGIEADLKEEASTLLGGSEVSMLDMAKLYSVFSNNGKLVKPQSILKITDRNDNILYEVPKSLAKRVLSKKTSQLIREGLRGVVRHGTGYRARYLGRKVVGKTGTSNHSKDNWFCGFTDDLVIIVWLGSDNQNSFRGRVAATNTATPLWASFAQKTIQHLKSRNIQYPNGLEKAIVHPRFGTLDSFGVAMYFGPGQSPTESNSDLKLLEEGKELRVGMNEL